MADRSCNPEDKKPVRSNTTGGKLTKSTRSKRDTIKGKQDRKTTSAENVERLSESQLTVASTSKTRGSEGTKKSKVRGSTCARNKRKQSIDCTNGNTTCQEEVVSPRPSGKVEYPASEDTEHQLSLSNSSSQLKRKRKKSPPCNSQVTCTEPPALVHSDGKSSFIEDYSPDLNSSGEVAHLKRQSRKKSNLEEATISGSELKRKGGDSEAVNDKEALPLQEATSIPAPVIIHPSSKQPCQRKARGLKKYSSDSQLVTTCDQKVASNQKNIVPHTFDINTAGKTAATSERKRKGPTSTKGGSKKAKQDNTCSRKTVAAKDKVAAQSADKTGGKVSRGRSQRAGSSGNPSTTGSCSSTRRSRRTRAQEGPSNMATQGGSGQPSEANGSHLRVEDPTPSSSSNAHDSDSNTIEDAEMSRLQALLEARGLPAHLFGTLGPRMHLLLHRTFSSGTGSKAQQLLTGMQSEEEGQQLQSVMEMCQLLVMGNEETLGGFPVKQAVPVLITLLQMEHNFDIMNHACRALTYLMEALPRSSAVVIDAIPAFLEKLQKIQCMDVAEQSLTALEMLSRRHGKAILQAGGLASSLLYLDFFSIAAQRSALAIAANCCHSVSPEEFHHVKDAIVILSGRLGNQDKKSIESVCLAFARLVDNFQKDQKLLEKLCAHGLLNNLQQLLVVSPPIISTGTFVMVIRMLAVMCASCPSIAAELLKQNIAETIRYLLVGSTDDGLGEVDSIELVPRSPQELYEITCLICELMPVLPNTGIFVVDTLLSKGTDHSNNTGCWQWRDDGGTWHSYMWVDNRILEAAFQSGEDEISLSTLGRNYIIDFTNMQQINEDTGTVRPIQRKPGPGQNVNNTRNEKDKQQIDERAQLLNSETDLARTFINSLLGVLFDVYYSSVGPAVKHKCLNGVLKMLFHYPPSELQNTLQKLPISSYIAGMMASPDLRTVCSALQMAEILMNKLPDVFHVFFRREGVMHKAQTLSSGNACSLLQRDGNHLETTPRPSDPVSPVASVDTTFEGGLDPLFHDLPSTPTTPRISDALKKRRITKRAGRTKGQKSAGDDTSTSPSSKKVASDTLRPRSSTFAASSSSGSSKTSFFSSFAPRWGRSQSYGGGSGSSGKGAKDGFAKHHESNKEEIRKWVQEQATTFFNTYFAEESGDSHPALSVLHQLTRAADELSIERDCGLVPLRDIGYVVKEESRSEEGASAFEILHSGLVTNLHKYLTSESVAEAVSRDLRLKRFLHVFLGCPEPDSVVPKTIVTATKPMLAPLIQKLNLCINQLEQFPVKCHDLPGSGAGSRGTSALRFFNTHQIKCNLQRLPDCTNLRQWKGGPVKIDPLALVQAIERYLVVRGYGRIREGNDDDDSDLEERSDDEIDESWASQLQGTNSPRHYLEFVMNGHVLPYNMTVYQAVRQYGSTCYDESHEVDDDQGPFGRASIWSETHTIWYRPITQSGNANSSVKKRVEVASKSSHRASIKSISRTKASDVAQFLSQTVNVNMNTSDPSLEVIALMRVLYFLNMNWGLIYESPHSAAVISVAEFINTKLTAKATRQLQDPLVIMTGNLPQWLSELALACPFTFPFECRQQLFYASTFDRDRAMMKLQENVPDLSSSEAADRVTPRLEKKKRTVTRTNLLKQAEAVMNDLANSKALLEIQYEGEVGTGLGPTLEFYSLTSKEFQKADLDMWRGDPVDVVEGDGEYKEIVQYVHSPSGLFPRPIPKSLKGGQLTKIKSRFRLLGRFVAKAIMDSRMIDIPFSQAFYKWMLGIEATLDLADLQFTDPVLHNSLSQLNDVVAKKKRIEEDSSHTPESLQLCLGSLTLDGLPIEDLGLDFVLPGQAGIELKKNGRDVPVTISNLEEYVKLVTHWTLVEGVSKQMHAFREGFESVFPSTSLRMFYPGEMDLLLCGSRSERWDAKELIDCCRPDHGYTHDSRAVRLLFEILSKYGPEDQRRFLQFITGSPRLPVGGFKSLNPPLTIVRKTVDPSANPDNYLPSVMTCVNYLKLPDYSSQDIMATKLRTAYTEGKNAFHLS